MIYVRIGFSVGTAVELVAPDELISGIVASAAERVRSARCRTARRRSLAACHWQQ